MADDIAGLEEEFQRRMRRRFRNYESELLLHYRDLEIRRERSINKDIIVDESELCVECGGECHCLDLKWFGDNIKRFPGGPYR